MTQFDDKKWDDFVNKISVVFNYGIAEKEWLFNNRLAKLIAATPFIAESRKAEIVSFSHLSLYLLSLTEIGKTIFVHREIDNDDVFSRLHPVTHYISGKRDVIDASNGLLALCMLSNYNKDRTHDLEKGKYNPVALGIWDYNELSENLVTTISKCQNSELFEIYSIKEARKGIWQ